MPQSFLLRCRLPSAVDPAAWLGNLSTRFDILDLTRNVFDLDGFCYQRCPAEVPCLAATFSPNEQFVEGW